jgi:hypothetical protein
MKGCDRMEYHPPSINRVILELKEYIKDRIAYTLFQIGIKPNISSGMLNEITYGYGKGDNSGYGQYGLYPKE